MALNKIADNNVSNPLTLNTLRVDGTFTSSGTAIFTGGTSSVGLVARQPESGIGSDIQQWQFANGSVLGRVDVNGELRFGATGSTVRFGLTPNVGAAVLVVSPPAAGYLGIVTRAFAGQTGNLFEIQNSAGASISRILSNGSMLIGNTTIADDNYISFIGAGTGKLAGVRWGNDGNGSDQFFLATNTTDGHLTLSINQATRSFKVRGAGAGGSSTQSVNMQEWQSWDGTTATTRANVDSAGNFRGSVSGHQYRAFNEDSTRVKFANWYSSDADQFGQGQNWNELWFGAINANATRRIGFYLNLPNATTNPGATNANMYITPTGVGINIASASVTSQLHVASGATDRIVQIIRGFGTGGSYTQTADLTQWQSFDGTTATTIAKVASNGVIFGAEVRTFNTQLVMREVAGGGNLYMAKATSAPGNPTANIGTLFYRDGTTAGTLKLATRTGASGVEETIVDNLSSTGSTAGAQFVGAGGVNTAGTLTSAGLILSSTTSPITLNGSVGTSGFVLTSAGAGATPTWTNPNLVNVNATAKTGAYTLATSDYGTMVQMNAAAAFTVGTGLYNAPVGTQITLLALVAGVTVAASGANVIVNATPGLKLRAQYSTATLICLSSGASACTWLLTGDLSA